MITLEQVYETVRRHGPVIANKIKQILGQGDATLVNVYLSQLKEEGKIKFTRVQLGSSAFAYTPEQIPKLESLIEHLNEKEKRVAQKLREEKIIRASKQDPLTRVALQNIKDFAKPLQVRTGNGEEVFYRWYQYDVNLAKPLIAELLGQKKQPEKEKESEVPTEQSRKESAAEPKKQEVTEKDKEPEKKIEKQVTLEDKKPEQEVHEAESEFGEKLTKYFEKKEIEVLHFKEIRKNSEIEAIVKLPTALGKVKFYCKARNKKNSNDGDLAAAILSAKARMLPALYITTGDVTNKARENPELQEITVIEIGNSH